MLDSDAVHDKALEKGAEKAVLVILKFILNRALLIVCVGLTS